MADKKLKTDLSSEYKLAGIATSLKEYKLCYHLNHLINDDFRKLKDLIFEPNDRTRTVQFSVFKAGEESDKNQYVVFTNKSVGQFLLPEVSNFDYIIQIQGKVTADEMKTLLNAIKKFPEVVLSAEIPLKKIKSRDRLIYEEEKPSKSSISTKKFK